MAASQAVQTAPPPTGTEPSASVSELPVGERLSLDEMTRIMDVAATLRRERTVADQLLNFDQIKAQLRERLLEAAKVSGDPVTSEEIDSAINQYYDRLHEFREPAFTWRKFVAFVWVSRVAIFKWLFGLTAAFLVIWGLLASGILPGEARNRQTLAMIEQRAVAVEKISEDATVGREVQTLVTSAKAAMEQGNSAKLTELATQIAAIQGELEQQYTLVIPSGPDDKSATERMWTDDAGTRSSGYFVIVKALGADGQPVKVPIANRETGKTEYVSTWGEQVPEAVFNRLAADKQADGVLDEKLFGEKERGSRAVKVELHDPSGAPVARGGQITSW